MATISKRKKRDGSAAYTAQIRMMRGGKLVHSEARTFPKKAMAVEWSKRRELELMAPGGIITAKWKGVTVGDAIERYVHEFCQGAGRTKLSTINQLTSAPIGRVKINELTSEHIISHGVMRINSGVKPQTVYHDMSSLGMILRTAAAAWKMPVNLSEFEEARLLMRSKGLVTRADQRERRPTTGEIDKIRAHFRRSHRRTMLPMEDLMDFAIASARRQDEITRILWSDLDTEASTCWVRDAKHPRKKQGNHKRFKLTREAMAIIQRQPRAEGEDRIFPFKGKSIGSRWGLTTLACGIEDLWFHDLRHEATSRLIEAGYDIVEVQQFTLHESWEVLKRYTHLRPENLKLREAPGGSDD